MENYVNVDLTRRRMHCRATGAWDRQRAMTFRSRMIEVVDRMCATGGAFTVLTDLTGLAIHAQCIAPIVGEGAEQILRATLSRYAMIVPTSLMRMQVRRIHGEVEPKFYDTRQEALVWLGWTETPALILQPPAG